MNIIFKNDDKPGVELGCWHDNSLLDLLAAMISSHADDVRYFWPCDWMIVSRRLKTTRSNMSDTSIKAVGGAISDQSSPSIVVDPVFASDRRWES